MMKTDTLNGRFCDVQFLIINYDVSVNLHQESDVMIVSLNRKQSGAEVRAERRETHEMARRGQSKTQSTQNIK